MKQISTRNLATVKRVAMNVYPLEQKRNKLQDKIDTLLRELGRVENEITEWELPVRNAYGYPTSDLLVRTITPVVNDDGTPKLDKKGQQIKKTVYEPNPLLVTYDETSRTYMIKEKEEQKDPETIYSLSDREEQKDPETIYSLSDREEQQKEDTKNTQTENYNPFDI